MDEEERPEDAARRFAVELIQCRAELDAERERVRALETALRWLLPEYAAAQRFAADRGAMFATPKSSEQYRTIEALLAQGDAREAAQ